MTVQTLSTIEKLKLNGELKQAIVARNAAINPLKKLPLVKAVQELRAKLGLIVGDVDAPKSTIVPESPEAPIWNQESIDAAKKELKSIKPYMPIGQYATVMEFLNGEEGEYFAKVVSELKATIHNMPKIGKTDGQGYEAKAQLHYFGGSADVYVTELDARTGEAFGAVDLGYGPELGYLSIAEYIANPMMNLDFHWTAKSLNSALSGENDEGDTQATPQQKELAAKVQTKKDTSGFYEHAEKRTKGQRQKANNAAIALLKQFESGARGYETVTDEERALLAKYSGSGGNLVTDDGKQGSAYEYYTPKPIAEGVWNMLGEMGFSGGKVLDPCAGVGIFGATAPQSAAIDAVELDRVSGGVNQLVNTGVGHNVTISAFEDVAANTPDETHDAVVTNVPFGDNSARGGNQFKDEKYQNDTLEAYFMLRSMDKLKPGGLAAFIVPPRVVSGRSERDEKLRQRLALKGEMMGAYRLPNTVFGAAHADTITDIVVLKKHSREVLDKVDELYGTNPDALREANVLWTEFIDGKYFAGEGKRFVLGEFQAKDPSKFRDVDRVISDQSTANVGKLLRKFGNDTRIKFDVLDVADAGNAIEYKDGDTIALNGQILTMQDGVWVQNQTAMIDAQMQALHANMAKIGTPMQALESALKWSDFNATLNCMNDIGKSLDIPAWASKVHRSLVNEDKAGVWFEAIVTGLAAKAVQVAHADEEDAENLVEAYPVLADAMKRYYKAKLTANVDGECRAAVKFIGIHYAAKTGFSAYWKGERAAKVVKLDTDAKLARTQYISGSLYLEHDKAKAIVEADGGVFDPLQDDDWMVSADGKRVIKADDYFVGNLGGALAKIDAEIAAAEDDAIKAKLERMKVVAKSRGNPLTVERMQFDVRSPMVHPSEVLQFFKAQGIKDCSIKQNDKNKRQFVDIHISGDLLRDKLLNRVGDYMKNGSVTLGGLDVSPMTEEEALAKLDQMIRDYNTRFNAWVKANPAIMSRLQTIAQDPNNIYFKQVDDKSKFDVDGISPEWSFHGYQCAFARRMSRSFSGINGFDTGLGKTSTALMSVQYVQNIGVKKKTLFLVPGSVLSNWRKEAIKGEGKKGEEGYKAPVYTNADGCLFVGLTEDKNGNASVNSKDYDRDLNIVLENRHNKVFMTYEAFQRIRLKEDTIEDYSAYLRTVDRSYGEAVKAAKDEKNKSKLGDLIKVLKGNKTSTAAPYFEDMGFDSIVIDEAHAFKNSKETVDFEGGKFLSTSGASTMGLDAQAKVWYIRRETPNNDGVLALTATPITNSPLEIYSMMTLAVGEERVNKMMLGATGADAFMEMVCSFQEQQEETVDGKVKSYRTFTGLRNLDALRQGLHDVAVIENAQTVGNDFTLPDALEKSMPVRLSDTATQRLKDYKVAYSVARELEYRKKTGRFTRDIEKEELDIYAAVIERTGEDQRLLAQPFNLINKMNNLIVDPDLDERATFYYTDNAEVAKKVCSIYNAKKITDKRKRLGRATEADIKDQTILKDGQGDILGTEYTVYTKATYDGQRIVLDSVDFKAQMAIEAMIDVQKLDVDMAIPPKFAALIANVKEEQANPRGIDGARRSQKAVKQIVFCDSLSSHTKVKRLLVKHCGIPASKITFISGQYNNEPEALLDVQAGFNAGDDENVYQIIIANKKGEVGINLQKGCQAIHHLTIGWTPDSLQQRNGRGVRQGNLTGYVSIYHYDADGTFDTYRRRLVNKKSDWIDSLLQEDGSDEVDVGGGLTREQQEALINMVGDEAAMSAFQDSVDAQDLRRRTLMNRHAQEVNLVTYMRSSKFLKRFEDFEIYANEKAKEFSNVREELEKAKTTLRRSIDKNSAEKTIAKNQKKVDELMVAAEAQLVKLMQNYDVMANTAVASYSAPKEKLDFDQAKQELLENGIANWRVDLTFKDGDSSIKREWENEVETNRRLLISAETELANSVKKTGAFDAETLEAAKQGEVVRFKGDMVAVGGVAKRVVDGVVSYALIEKSGGGIELRYFDKEALRTGHYSAGYYSSGANNYLSHNKDDFEGVYSQNHAEYQNALAYFASYDNHLIQYYNGALTPSQQERLAAYFLPEIANMHTQKVEQRFGFRIKHTFLTDKQQWPTILNPDWLDMYGGGNSENEAKWQALIDKQAPLIVSRDYYGIETTDQDAFEEVPSNASAVFFAALKQHSVKLSAPSAVSEMFTPSSGYTFEALELPESVLTACLAAIEAAESIDKAHEAVAVWFETIFSPYFIDWPKRFEEVNISGLTNRLFDQAKQIKAALAQKEQSLKVLSPEDYVYLTGDTRAAFGEVPFRDIAKESGSEIGWNPAGRKAPRYGDKAVIEKARLAPSGVWVFQRKMWTYMQEDHASEIAQFNLDVKEGIKMAYRYLIDEQEAETQAAALAASLKANTGKSDFVGFAVNVIVKRLKQHPQKYREFGPYWPALKALLNSHGANLGDDLLDDPLAKVYTYKQPATLIAAVEGFKDFYRETWAVGNNEFTIDDEGRNWVLFDEDMELKY